MKTGPIEFRGVRVYVAGPYSSPDPAVNTRNAILVGDDLLSRGFTPFVPHLTHFWHMLCPRQYEQWLALDNEWVAVCDMLLRMPGASSGADKEVELAKSLGIPVYHSVEELAAACEART